MAARLTSTECKAYISSSNAEEHACTLAHINASARAHTHTHTHTHTHRTHWTQMLLTTALATSAFF